MFSSNITISGQLLGVGLCLGIILSTIVFFIFLIINNPKQICISKKLIIILSFFNVIYFVLKLLQLNAIGVSVESCITLEYSSILFYNISLLILFLIYIFRYIEIYKFNFRIVIMSVFLAIFIATIPLSIVYNTSQFNSNSCHTNHPLISTLYPLITFAVLGLLNIVFFVEPLFKISKLNQYVRKSAHILFWSILSAMIFNGFFLITLQITGISDYAPLISSLDITVSFLSVVFPYFFIKISKLRSSPLMFDF
jgi:hypothetical protein